MLKVNKLSELDAENVTEFMYGYDVYRKDTKLRDILNKMFSAKFKQAFSTMKNGDKTPSRVDLGGSYTILLNEKGKFVQLWNSEWGAIEYVD